MVKEEYIIKLSLLEQKSKELEQQISIIDQQISEIRALQASLKKIGNSDEIIAPFGKGIFAKTKLMDKNFFVSVGAGIVLKRNEKETEEIIENQINELSGIRENFIQEISRINLEFEKLIGEVQVS